VSDAGAMLALDGDTELIEVPVSTAWIGARDDCFAHDNERPRHALEMAAFRIARTPVTNASWLGFSEAAATSGASGGRIRAGRGGRATTSSVRPDGTTGRQRI